MAFYIAICDDNIGDRKHFERLLDRENTKRIQTTGVLYIDAYGSEKTLLPIAAKYDLFLIDVTKGAANGLDIARRLRSDGITSSIVLCSSVIDYRFLENIPDNIIHLKKSVTAEQISEILDSSITEKYSLPPLIALDEIEQSYIASTEIIFAKARGNSILVAVTGNKELLIQRSADSFFKLLSSYPCFLFIGKYYIINIKHVRFINFNSLELTEKHKAFFPLFQKKELLRIMNNYWEKI